MKMKLQCHSLWLEERSLLCPPRIREICKPLLKAWLKSILVWNSETNGNHAKKATGVKRSKPIITSYPRASARTDPQNQVFLMRGLQACAIFLEEKQEDKENEMSKCSNWIMRRNIEVSLFYILIMKLWQKRYHEKNFMFVEDVSKSI